MIVNGPFFRAVPDVLEAISGWSLIGYYKLSSSGKSCLFRMSKARKIFGEQAPRNTGVGVGYLASVHCTSVRFRRCSNVLPLGGFF